MKTCNKCDSKNPEFYINDKTCKECRKKRVRENYRKNIEHYKAYEQERCNLPHRVKAREDYAKTDNGIIAGNRAKKAWVERNPEKNRGSCESYLEKNPKKKYAHEQLRYAVVTGKIKRGACEICGATYRVHGHHDDYSRPLNVRWLCSAHHKQWHRENGEGLNG